MRLITKYKLVCTLAIILLTSIFSIGMQNIRIIDASHIASSIVARIVSSSAGAEGFIVTTLVFCLIPFLLSFSFAQKKLILTSFIVVLACAFGIKTTLKTTFEAPRPFVEELVNLGSISTSTEFYQLSDPEKLKVIDDVSLNVDKWRLQEWQDGSDYSFPSGHMLFAVVVTIFWAPVLIIKRYYCLAAMSVIWASGVGASRLWLGMHRLEDLYASIVIALILCMLAPKITRMYWNKFEFSHRTKSHSPNVASPW